MQFKSFIKTRNNGFWTTTAVSTIALIATVVYAVCYASSLNFSVMACVLTAVCALCFGLSFTKFCEIIPFIQLVAVLLAFGFYAYSLYYYVSVVLVGIDIDSFSVEFIICSLLYAVLLVTAAANIFFKQGAKECLDKSEGVTL